MTGWVVTPSDKVGTCGRARRYVGAGSLGSLGGPELSDISVVGPVGLGVDVGCGVGLDMDGVWYGRGVWTGYGVWRWMSGVALRYGVWGRVWM